MLVLKQMIPTEINALLQKDAVIKLYLKIFLKTVEV